MNNMKRTEIRDYNNQIIGYVDVDEKSGDKTIRDFNNQIQGYYKTSDNTTRNFNNQIVYRGDMLTSLLNKK